MPAAAAAAIETEGTRSIIEATVRLRRLSLARTAEGVSSLSTHQY